MTLKEKLEPETGKSEESGQMVDAEDAQERMSTALIDAPKSSSQKTQYCLR